MSTRPRWGSGRSSDGDRLGGHPHIGSLQTGGAPLMCSDHDAPLAVVLAEFRCAGVAHHDAVHSTHTINFVPYKPLGPLMCSDHDATLAVVASPNFRRG